jgi:hypothetical protein
MKELGILPRAADTAAAPELEAESEIERYRR